jgi:glycosyltransferase involved in cell wall biosynthesis
LNIRLLYLTAETYPTFRADVNVLFGKVLPQYGIQSDIVAGKAEGKVETDTWGGGETYLCDVSGGSVKKHIKTLLHGVKHLLKADTNRYQAIQVRDMPLLAAIGLLVARLKGLKFFYWMSYPMPDDKIISAHDRGLSMGLIKFLFPWVSGHIGRFLLYRVVLPKADHAFVQSDQMKADLVKCGISPERMTPVPMGVDMETLRNYDIHPIDDMRLAGKRVLVYLGTLHRPRRIETLFEMLAIVKLRFPNVLLMLVGGTHEEIHQRWLKMKADEAGISEHLLWTGWLPMYEGWRYVRAAEVGLSPFPRGYLLDSASPTKVPEYLALGVPVVCNDNPDQEQVIRQSGAGMCVPYSAEDFASAAIKILCLDKNERKEMGIKGRDYVSRYRDYQMIGGNVADSYRNLLLKDDCGEND